MLRRLSLGFALSLMTAPVLFAHPSLPSQVISNLPWSHLPAKAASAICFVLGLC